MCNVLLIRAGQASLSNLVGLANMVSHCFMLQFQSCLCMKTVAPSNTDKKFSKQFNVHTADSLWNIPVHKLLLSPHIPLVHPLLNVELTMLSGH